MDILVLNCGSSSIKAAVVDTTTGQRLIGAAVQRLGEPRTTLSFDGGDDEFCPGESHEEALAHLLPRLRERLGDRDIEGVGHRVVHGGDEFTQTVRIDADVEAAIDRLSDLAPLHNPENLAGIRAARHILTDVPHVAVFDTAFHGTMPDRARTYALPREVAEEHGLRRYGFHGTSHAWVARRAADHLGEDVRDLRIITCHLGNGASVAAVEYGRSIETSMGMTPLEGLVMGTRSGDVDPGILIKLLREGLDADALDEMLNRQSGLAGLSGVGRDLRDIERRSTEGDERCRQAIQVFSHRLRKYIGAYAAVMGGVDAIVFTAGIGENSALIRHRAAQRLDFLGARLDETANREAEVDRESQPVAVISTDHSRVKLLVVATDEEREIARETAGILAGQDQVQEVGTIPVAISARHVHLDRKAVEALFGEGHELHPDKELSQPGQFAAWERVTLVGPKGTIEGVRVIGPVRDHTQIEISRTDEFALGIDAPVRMSGDIQNTPGITLRGPEGDYLVEDGVICSQRHIHMTPDDAERFGVEHRDVVQVAIDSDGRDLLFGDVVVRVKDSYRLEMHLDTDEGNAAELTRGATGVLYPTEARVKITRRATRFD